MDGKWAVGKCTNEYSIPMYRKEKRGKQVTLSVYTEAGTFATAGDGVRFSFQVPYSEPETEMVTI